MSEENVRQKKPAGASRRPSLVEEQEKIKLELYGEQRVEKLVKWRAISGLTYPPALGGPLCQDHSAELRTVSMPGLLKNTRFRGIRAEEDAHISGIRTAMANSESRLILCKE